MIVEKIIGLSAINDYCNVGKDVDGNGGTVGYGSMIMEKTIGLFAINDDRDVGKDVDITEEGRCTQIMVTTQ